MGQAGKEELLLDGAGRLAGIKITNYGQRPASKHTNGRRSYFSLLLLL